MPEILASRSRASGFSVYLLKSKSTSGMLTIRPRARVASHQNLIELRQKARAHLFFLGDQGFLGLAARRFLFLAFGVSSGPDGRLRPGLALAAVLRQKAAAWLPLCVCLSLFQHRRRRRASSAETSLCILFVLLGGCRIGFSFGLSVGGGLPGGVFALLLFATQGQYAGVFGHLRGAARRGSDRSAALFALIVIFGALQHIFRFHDAASGILLGAGGFRDHHGVAGFEQIEWHIRLRA